MASRKVDFRQTAPSETLMDTEFREIDSGRDGLFATSSWFIVVKIPFSQVVWGSRGRGVKGKSGKPEKTEHV